jgi:hypothetical protein
MTTNPDETIVPEAEFAERVRRNQQNLGAHLSTQYDFVVWGSGSSGSVVARRLAENPDVSVLLLEAGGDADVPEVMRAEQWPLNLGSERDWNFAAQPNPHLNGRSIPYSMGKVLGGGSSINVMAWARGHKTIGTSSPPKPATRRGTANRCSTFTAASRTGMAPPTPTIAEPAAGLRPALT